MKRHIFLGLIIVVGGHESNRFSHTLYFIFDKSPQVLYETSAELTSAQ